MSEKVSLTYPQINQLAMKVAKQIDAYMASWNVSGRLVHAFPIVRGGVSAAMAVSAYTSIKLVDDPKDADIFIDDIIDSGATMQKWCDAYPGKPFFALVDRTSEEVDPLTDGKWVVFPWEGDAEGSFEDNVRRMLQFIGEDPNRGGLIETPARVAKAWQHWCGGYGKDPAAILKVFEDGAEKHDQMVTVVDIPFYSHCEHHMAPIIGTATVSYIPNGKIVGLSKLSRLVDMYARRLQVQERLTDQIADALHVHLNPVGVGVVIKARHMCMESRGVCQQGHHTVTTALRGVLLKDAEARSEFLRVAM